MEDTPTKGVKIQLSMGQVIRLRLKEMAGHYGVSDSEMVRTAINEMYEGAYRRAKFGYQGGMDTGKLRVGNASKKNVRDNQIKAIKEMSNDQIMDWLREIGFAADKPEGEVVNTSTGAVRKFVMRTE